MDDLNALLDGTVEDVKERLDGLSPETLGKLHEAEKAGQKRTTLLTAIEHAQAAKADSDAAEKAAGETAETFTREQVDAMIAEREEAWAAEKDRAVAEAKSKPVPKAAAKPPKPAKPLAIGERVGNPYEVLTTGGSVVFVTDDAVPVAGLPAMTFPADAFEPAGDNAVKLKKDVDFPNTLAKGELHGAFLLDDEDEPIGRATLIEALPFGGGRDVRLGSGALLFTKD